MRVHVYWAKDVEIVLALAGYIRFQAQHVAPRQLQRHCMPIATRAPAVQARTRRFRRWPLGAIGHKAVVGTAAGMAAGGATGAGRAATAAGEATEVAAAGAGASALSSLHRRRSREGSWTHGSRLFRTDPELVILLGMLECFIVWYCM